MPFPSIGYLMIERSALLDSSLQKEFRADVVVVGSGAGGASVAGELRRLGRDVLVIEAGGNEEGPIGSHITGRGDLARARQTGSEDLMFPANGDAPVSGLPGLRTFHGIGGLLTRWAGVVPRPHLEEEWNGPFPAQELARLLDDADALVGSTPTNKLRIPNHDAEPALQNWLISQLEEEFGPSSVGEGARPARTAGRITREGTVQLAGADALLEAPEGSGALQILPDHVVTRILHSGSRATGVLAQSSNGEVHIAANDVVVAAGAIGTAQLLVASGMDSSPALGRYLTDHLMIYFKPFPLRAQAPVRSKSEIIFSVILPVTYDRPFQIALLENLAQADPNAPVPPDRSVAVGIFVGTEPRAQNRLEFHPEEVDSFGLPRVKAHIELSEEDHARVTQALTHGYRAANAIGEPWGNTAILPADTGSSLHVMGTHRMGDDPSTSVTDADCRMWGWDNVYLAGNGMLGSRNSCNPTLTTIALGLKAARAIAATNHSKDQQEPLRVRAGKGL